jgi:hypothetical protein
MESEDSLRSSGTGRGQPIERRFPTNASFPDLSTWDQRPCTQLIPEKIAAACPYLGGSEQKPRDLRTLRRWRESRRGPQFRKIGGRLFYTVGALRDFYDRSIRGGFE